MISDRIIVNSTYKVVSVEDHSDRAKTIVTVTYIVSAEDVKHARRLVKKHAECWNPKIKSVRKTADRAKILLSSHD